MYIKPIILILKNNIMNSILKIFIILAVFFLLRSGVQAQFRIDTIVNVSIENHLIDTAGHYSEFDIYIARVSDVWHLWENATLQMECFDGLSEEIKYSDFCVSIVDGKSEVILDNNVDFYSSKIKLMDDRLMLIITGPERYYNAKAFQSDEKLRLCRIRLASNAPQNHNKLPAFVRWKNPFDYYQAIAYKFVENVDKLPEFIVDGRDEDNIDVGWATSFGNDEQIAPPIMHLSYFTADYVGNLNVVLNYATQSEYKNKGFVIKRAINPNYRVYDTAGTEKTLNDIPDELFTVVIGDYRTQKFSKTMSGLYTSLKGKIYDPVPDAIDYRELYYVYRLYNQIDDGTDNLNILATAKLITPNKLIEVANSPSPNPFSDYTTVEYKVSDDVYLTCEVFDELGKKIKYLADNVNGILDRTYVRKGSYYAQFPAQELTTQGLYEIRFTAYPVNYDTYLGANAFVKAQLNR